MTNQLLAAEPLPDLSEYDGVSVVDIAYAIVSLPAGSEQQSRAIAAIQGRAPGIGHNRPPLEEALEAELSSYASRALQLLDVAKKAVIVDDESAAKIIDTGQLIRKLESELDEMLKARSAPYRAALRKISDLGGAILRPLEVARQGGDGRGGLRLMLTQWDDRKREAADAERRALEAEARARDEAAAKAREKADAAATIGTGAVAASIEAMKAEDEAETAARRAAAIRPEPTRSHTGQVGRRRERVSDITDLKTFVLWVLDQPGLRGNLLQACKTILGAYVKGLTLEVIEAGVEIPGATASVQLGAANVRS